MKSNLRASHNLRQSQKGQVYFQELHAGTISEQDGNSVFSYDPRYLNNPAAQPISLTLPLQSKPFVERTMIPFFDGLIPEGWVLDIAMANWKIDKRDRMGLLLQACEDCIGAVSVYAEGRTPNKRPGRLAKALFPQQSQDFSSEGSRHPNPSQCLVCFEKLHDTQTVGEYHTRCCKDLFGTRIPPHVNFDLKSMKLLADKNVLDRTTVTGVQPKLSLDLVTDRPQEEGAERGVTRLTVVGLWGRFILKPPSPMYPDMPVVESATMRMALASGLQVASHGLIRLQSGELAYLARRFDRTKNTKLPLEDACQLSGLLTEKKYKSSLEKAGKLVEEHSSFTGLDVIRFYEVALFSYLTGNSDMHLKNFSLLTRDDGRITLSPAYDLLATQLLIPADLEESALTINGKRAKLKRSDFLALAGTLSITEKATENAFKRMGSKLPAVLAVLESSPMSIEMKRQLKSLVRVRAKKLDLL